MSRTDADNRDNRFASPRQLLNAIRSGKFTADLPWTGKEFEALRCKGHELGLDVYAIRDEYGRIIRASPGLFGVAVLYAGHPVGQNGWRADAMMRAVERGTKAGSIPSVKVGRTREPIVSGDIRQQIEAYARQAVREYEELEPVAGT